MSFPNPGNSQQRRIRTRKYRGIVLGIWALSAPDRPYYRIRVGKELGLAQVAGLSREWLDVYLEYFEARGQRERAQELRRRWLSAPKQAAQ